MWGSHMFKRALGAKVFLEKTHGPHEGLRRPCSLLRRPPSTLKEPFIVPQIKVHIRSYFYVEPSTHCFRISSKTKTP